MARDTAVLGVDAPLIRECPGFSDRLPMPPVYLVLYRRWAHYVSVHVVNGMLAAEVHALLVRDDGTTRSADWWSPSGYRYEQMLPFLRELTGVIQGAVDDAWANDEESYQAAQREWEYVARANPKTLHERIPPPRRHSGILN